MSLLSDRVGRPATWPATAAAVLALAATGCSSTEVTRSGQEARPLPALASARSVGRGPRFRPPATSARVAAGRPVGGLRCGPPRRVLAAAHVEVFAAGHVVQVPAGIGVAPPLERRGAYVLGGRCTYPLRTVEPTGLILMDSSRPRTLGLLFALWGQRLSRRTVATFSVHRGARVSVFLDGVMWPGDPASAPLAPWSQVAIEIGPRVPAHRRYTFPSLSSIQARR